MMKLFNWIVAKPTTLALLYSLVFRHCEKNYTVIRRSNPVKNSNLQNFFNYLTGLPRRVAPRNDGVGIDVTTPTASLNDGYYD
ncbi:MAG TPA: hypothetical protein LFV92_03215 [Rickettsia endosymbiont of Ceroptres masudai]|nr:hypothetical protein [Rickettsia endosymbiont of Ceroptres masudai]